MNKPSAKTIAMLVRTAVGLALLIAAGAITAYLVATKPQVSKSDIDTQSVRVQVVRVEPIDVARQWRGYGTVEATDSADVPARIGATVVAIPEGIDAGRVVSAGQTLAELDKTDFANTFNAAEKRIAEADAQIKLLGVEEARLKERLELEQRDAKLARTEYDRQAARRDAGAASEADIDRAQRAVINAERAVLATQQQLDAIAPRLAGLEAVQAAAQADRDTAKANLQRATITAPIAGLIQSLDIEVGENLAPGARVARIVDPRKVEVPLQLPASARSYITLGNDVTLTTRSQPDDCPPWKARVARISAVNTPTRTFAVYAEVDQSHVPLRNFAEGDGPYKLPVGAFTLARLDTAEPSPRVILPARAIQEGRIRTVVEGEVVGRSVEVAFEIEGNFEQFGLPDTQWVALKTPLEPGELVVLSAAMTILDGQRVEPVVSNDKAQTPGATNTAATNGPTKDPSTDVAGGTP